MLQQSNKGHRQRLRERFLKSEENSRSQEALLELLLTYAIPLKDVQPLAKELLAEFGSLSGVLDASMEELSNFNGLSDNSAVLLKLVNWIRQHYGEKRVKGKAVKQESQANLFDVLPATKQSQEEFLTEPKPLRHKVITPRGIEMFSKAVLKEAIEILPGLPDTESLDEVRTFLRANLHFNSEQTRQRHAHYIISRMFPDGYADRPLRSFAKAYPDTQELRDVCFYRFLKSEPLETDIIEALILPNPGSGCLSRKMIRKYLSEKFPSSRSIVECGQAVVDALTAAKVVSADRTKINFACRAIPVFSFAFLLHSEFPNPGIYDIEKIENNRLFRAMLWNPEQLLPTLYELRNQGFINKVSEIDSVRQFTIKYTLAEAVEQIVSAGKKG